MHHEEGTSVQECVENGHPPAPGKSDQVKRGRKRKRSTHPPKEDDNVFEVEQILDHRVVAGRVTELFVKWKGWPAETNTWERLENMTGCIETIVEYMAKLDNVEPQWASQVEVYRKHLCNFTEEEMLLLGRQYLREDIDVFPQLDEEDTDHKVMLIARLPREARDPKHVKEIRNECMMLKLKKLREAQLKNLKEWEKEINIVSTDEASIIVTNAIDLDMRPLDFKYINKYKQNMDEKVSEDPVIGCECNPCTKNSCLCLQQSGELAYSNGLIKVPKGTPIYECNSKCKCGPTCPNRVLQKGRTVKLNIFKTNNGCGWGVRTLEKIAKGQFVAEYVGEVITSLEAERRGKQYNREGRTYLFDLDFNDNKDFPYTVDAAEYGNVSHFFNHSCNPNLHVYAVWVECLDPNMPRLGLFASRNINQYEELTFDYLCKPVGKNERAGGTLSESRVFCKCNSKNCRSYLF